MFIDHPYLTVLIVSIAVLVIENLPIQTWRGYNRNDRCIGVELCGRHLTLLLGWSGGFVIKINPTCRCSECQQGRKGR